MIDDNELQKQIGWSPYWPKKHEAQIKILNCKEPKVVIFAGKGMGKSMVCAYVALRTFLNLLEEVKEGKRKTVKIWIVAPTYELSRKVFSYFITWLLEIDSNFGKYFSDRAGPKLEIAKQIWVQGKSADEPQSLMGERLDLLIIDEAPYLKKKTWEHELSPTMAMSTESRVFFIGTPRGKNWVYQLWIIAKEKGAGFQFPSAVNPYLSSKRLEEIKAMISEDAWQQEYMGIPQETASSFFRNFRNCVNPLCLGEPRYGRKYVMGLDLAQIKDFTVLFIIDLATHEVKKYDRFQRIPYPLQIDRIYNWAQKYNNAKIVVELNNVGLAVADELRARGAHVQGFKTTGTTSFTKPGTKEEGLKWLALGFENKNIAIPDWDILIDELDIFGQELTPAGNLKLGAPEGYHDDCVMALVFAYSEIHGKTKTINIKAAKSMPTNIRKPFQYY